MNGMRKAAAAVIVGLTAASVVSGTASAADKSVNTDAPSAKAVVTGQASRAAAAKVPQAHKISAVRQKTAVGESLTAAASPTTSCNTYANGTGDMCFWYLTGFQGSRGGFYSNDSNFGDNYFVTPGAGQGTRIANNAESDYNYDNYYTAKVSTSVNYYGYVGSVAPRHGGNFNPTYKNNVESLYWA